MFSTVTVSDKSNVQESNVSPVKIAGLVMKTLFESQTEKNCLLNSSNAVAPSFKPK